MAVTLVVVGAALAVVAAMLVRVRCVLTEKAEQSQRCFEALKAALGTPTSIPVVFCVNLRRVPQLLAYCFADLPLPKYKLAFIVGRLLFVTSLFKRERVLQTPAAAGALAACSSMAWEIGQLRGMNGPQPKTYCDVAMAGFQAGRLLAVCSYTDRFTWQRHGSALRVLGAFAGVLHKYRTRDRRLFSFHVYYARGQARLIKALGIKKAPEGFLFTSVRKDRRLVAKTVAALDSETLEALAFASGASGCVLRQRDEWERSPVGKAVKAMPLIKTTRVGDAVPSRSAVPPDGRAPLTGIKVLDLTHIIAGPACSRVLAEYGADVLLVRRGGFDAQEQSFFELDGWAGKRSIQLDFDRANDLARVKELVREADVVVSSYQPGVLDRFGLSAAEIHALNPRVIYGAVMCFSDSVWHDRPGWAPLAEDITGLSLRNGSRNKPKNLNGVPLDYIPGFICALGVLAALKQAMTTGGTYSVTVSLTRVATWLHEITDRYPRPSASTDALSSTVEVGRDFGVWGSVLQRVDGTAVGAVAFPAPPVVNPAHPSDPESLRFTDGNSGWST
jgi:hypothetical protein